MLQTREANGWILAAPLLAVVGLFYIVPLLEVLRLGFSDPSPGLGNYIRIANSESIHRVILTTLRICAISTLVSVLIGYLISYVIVFSKPRSREFLFIFVITPLWVSVLVRAFAWLTLLKTQGPVNQILVGSGLIEAPLSLVRNELGVMIGIIHYMIPYAVLPLYAGMLAVDQKLLAASRTLGASQFQTFLHIFLPLTLPSIAGAALITFVLGLGFYVTPVVLGGGKVVMLAEYVTTNVLYTPRWGLAAALSTLLLVAVLALLAVMARIQRSGELVKEASR